MERTKYVLYGRVSTKEQGKTGLGLESQWRVMKAFVEQTDGEIMGEFQDIDSGSKKKRVGIMNAIQKAQEVGGILLVKDLDRLSRAGLSVIVEMEDKKVKFIDCSSPHDSELIKEIKLSIARDELRKIKNRTADALNEIKEAIKRDGFYEKVLPNGSKKKIYHLGNEKGNGVNEKGRKASLEVRRVNSEFNNREMIKLIKMLDGDGLNFTEIARRLNKLGYKTPKGNEIFRVTVERLHKMHCLNTK